MFRESIENRKGKTQNEDPNNFGEIFFGKVGHESEVKGDVSQGGKQTAVEAGIVTKDAGTGVNGKDGGEGLRNKKQEQKRIEPGAGEVELFVDDNPGQPERSNDDGDGVDKHHFGELKKFGIGGRPDERQSEDEKSEAKTDKGTEVGRSGRHVPSLMASGEVNKCNEREKPIDGR